MQETQRKREQAQHHGEHRTDPEAGPCVGTTDPGVKGRQGVGDEWSQVSWEDCCRVIRGLEEPRPNVMCRLHLDAGPNQLSASRYFRNN